MRTDAPSPLRDRKSTRLNSSHLGNSYAVFCLKKKKKLAAFSISFILLTLLLVLRGDLLSRWEQLLPPDSPNYFLLNITKDQVPQWTGVHRQHHSVPARCYSN